MKANDIRKNIVVMYNNVPHRVMDFHHHTPGNLRAMVQTKLRNLLSGNRTEVRFSSTEDIQEADVNTTAATYLYADGDNYNFMNAQTYEEVIVSGTVLGDGKYYLQDQMSVNITYYNGEPIGVDLPTTVTLTVAETQPEIRGGTASSSGKPAITDTGLTVSVPPFVKIGDKIVVNTSEGKYISRAE